LVIIIALVAIFFAFSPFSEGSERVSIDEIMRLIQAKEISEIEVEGESIRATALDGDRLKSNIGENTDIFELFGTYGIDPQDVDPDTEGNQPLSVVFVPSSGWGQWVPLSPRPGSGRPGDELRPEQAPFGFQF
jgi:hypothetical protein